VSDDINAVFDLADREGDRFMQNSLQWFIQEQLEEVLSTDEFLQIVKRAGGGGLLFVERFLASRGGGGKGAEF
jgi:ferritin